MAKPLVPDLVWSMCWMSSLLGSGCLYHSLLRLNRRRSLSASVALPRLLGQARLPFMAPLVFGWRRWPGPTICHALSAFRYFSSRLLGMLSASALVRTSMRKPSF